MNRIYPSFNFCYLRRYMNSFYSLYKCFFRFGFFSCRTLLKNWFRWNIFRNNKQKEYLKRKNYSYEKKNYLCLHEKLLCFMEMNN